jgi:hypothetical protein
LYCVNNPINKIDPWGLDSVALYDAWDKGGKGDMAQGSDFRQAACQFDWALPVSSPDMAAGWLELLSDIGVVIDDVYIFDHGIPGNQQIGKDILNPLSSAWERMTSTVENEGTIHLRGCSIAWGTEGIGYLYDLAKLGKRTVDAFDNIVSYGWLGNPTESSYYYSWGALWTVQPTGKIESQGPFPFNPWPLGIPRYP